MASWRTFSFYQGIFRVLAATPGSVRQSEAANRHIFRFSLTFQDAIKDGLRAVQNCVEDEVWEVGGWSDLAVGLLIPKL